MANGQLQVDPKEELQSDPKLEQQLDPNLEQLDPKALGFEPTAEMRTLGTGGTGGGEEDPAPPDPSGLQALLTIRGDRLFIIASIPLSEDAKTRHDKGRAKRPPIPPGFIRAAKDLQETCTVRLQFKDRPADSFDIDLWQYHTEDEVAAAVKRLQAHERVVHSS